MKTIYLLAGILILTAAAGSAVADSAAQDEAANWPQWRGPGSSAVSSAVGLPETWSAEENIAWKTAIPGSGHASPSVWGDRIFLITAIPQGVDLPEGHPDRGRGIGPGGPNPTIQFSFEVLCLDRTDGRIIWQRTARIAKPAEGINRLKGSYANSTPATDGEHVYVSFGSEGIYCYDMDGELAWERDLGDMKIAFNNGEGASPVVYGDRVIVIWDHQGQSFITALDKQTGEEIWRADRDELTNWTTPVLIEHEGTRQIVANGTTRVRAYDFETGSVTWECGGMTVAAIPTLVHGHGMIYAASGYMGHALMAIRLGGSGDITGSDSVAWSHDKDTAYVPSPLLYGDELYLVNDKGIVSCRDAETGAEHYSGVRLPGVYAVSASPVAADGKVYILGEEGRMVVVKAGPEFEVLAENLIEGERFLASPAIVDGGLILRGETHLYSISKN